MANNLAVYLREQQSLLTVTQVATLLGFNKSTVYNFAKQEIIPSIMIGSSLRFDPHDIAEWIEENHIRATRGYFLQIIRWIRASLIEAPTPSRLPKQLQKVFATFSYDWLQAVKSEGVDDHRYANRLDELQEAIFETLSVVEQRALLSWIWSESQDFDLMEESTHA